MPKVPEAIDPGRGPDQVAKPGGNTAKSYQKACQTCEKIDRITDDMDNHFAKTACNAQHQINKAWSVISQLESSKGSGEKSQEKFMAQRGDVQGILQNIGAQIVKPPAKLVFL